MANARVLFSLSSLLTACGFVDVQAVTREDCLARPELAGCVVTMPDLDAAQPSTMDASKSLLDASSDAHEKARDAASTLEVCDGIDNDGDGEIDNVDVAGDGVCDCMMLATLGVRGKWGSGNVFADWLSSRSDSPAASLDGQTLTLPLLMRYRVVVVQDIQDNDYGLDELVALHQWIVAGGGLFVTTGYGSSDELTNVNAMLAPSGVQYAPKPVFAAGPNKTIAVTEWGDHPVATGVSALGVDSGYEVTGSGAVVAEQDGHVALRALDDGAGRVLVWMDDWITYDSEWKSHPEYQVERFWLNAIKWLSPPKECQVAIPFL